MTPALLGAAAIPLIAGTVQAARTAGLPNHLAPILALFLGAAAGALSAWQTPPPDWAAGIALGLAWGLAASGLHSGAGAIGRRLAGRANPYGRPAPGRQAGQPITLPSKPMGPAA